jgi:ankyrin repeat protein
MAVSQGRSSLQRISKMNFINLQNNDGLTAIHYAAFRGNIRVLEYLIKNGGNPFIKDNDGHNVIHIAAQGDKVNVIHYFIKNFNFDVNDRDNKESSALHWSAYLNKEIALTYLVAWGANVDAQDAEKNTPLHLAVLTSEKVQETR